MLRKKTRLTNKLNKLVHWSICRNMWETGLGNYFICDFKCSPDNSPTNQLLVSHVADWSTCGLVNSPKRLIKNLQ